MLAKRLVRLLAVKISLSDRPTCVERLPQPGTTTGQGAVSADDLRQLQQQNAAGDDTPVWERARRDWVAIGSAELAGEGWLCRHGPVAASRLLRLRQEGTVAKDTLVAGGDEPRWVWEKVSWRSWHAGPRFLGSPA